MVFFGASSNGITGERAQWTKNSGVRIVLDSNSNFKHPILSFIDGFVIKAAEITNEWFFDIVVTAMYGLQPVDMAPSFAAIPQTEEKKQGALANYVHEIQANSGRGWDLVKIGNDRKYKTADGKELTSRVENNSNGISINFFERFGADQMEEANKRMMEFLEAEKEANPTSPANQQQPPSEKPSGSGGKKWWKFWE